MKDIRGREQTEYIVRDRKTGKTYRTYESYARKLDKEKKVTIIASEGEKDFEKHKVKTKKA